MWGFAVLVGLVAAGCGFQHGSSSRDDATAPIDDVRRIDDVPGEGMPPPEAATGCSSAGLACANGSTVALTCNGACWVRCILTAPASGHFTVAQACIDWGGKLAPIRSAADQACVSQTLFPAQASWIGFEQAGTATTVGGLWTWNGDGNPVTYTAWGQGQPNDFNGAENGQENCAFMNTNGEWHDLSCSDATLLRFSCRK